MKKIIIINLIFIIFYSLPIYAKEIVAIIDTGFTREFVASCSNVWVNEKEIPNNGIDDDHNGYIDDYYGYNFLNKTGNIFNEKDIHGTYVASIIQDEAQEQKDNYDFMFLVGTCSSKYGIAWDFQVKNAIKYAIKNGATIINMSINFTNKHCLDRLIKQNPNVLFLLAAGNDNENVKYSKFNNLIVCASNDRNYYMSQDNIQKSEYSNYGENIDICTEGDCSTLSKYQDANLLSTIYGTSFSVARITGKCIKAAEHLQIKDLKKYMENNSTILRLDECGKYINSEDSTIVLTFNQTYDAINNQKEVENEQEKK